MLDIFYSAKIKKDYKIIKKRGYDLSKLQEVLQFLVKEELLDPKYNDHKLTGNYSSYRECHIEPDWLLIYKIDNNRLYLMRMGTHSDLFKK